MLAADGERVPIEDISPRDEVVATDPETGERVTRTVDASWSHVDQTVTISIDDRELVTTEDHRFWSQTAGAFVPAGDLEVGDKVVGDHGRVHTVTRTAEVGGYERVWNLSIDQVHTYHVGDADILVHNTCPPLPRPKVQSQRLRNIVDELYKAVDELNRFGNGTTMDAIRFERATGGAVKGKVHMKKGYERVRGLRRWLRTNKGASYNDQLVARSLLWELEELLY